ncbi:MAG TPA: hypothetical protein VJS44_08340 [Pyrinomonadaceae bacterium]|nr:hypothetical protein [Pyrinomonadaceae bacterium]
MQTTAQVEPVIAAPADTDEVQPLETEKVRAKRFRARLKGQQKDREEELHNFLLGRRDYFRALDPDARNKHLRDVDMMCRYVNGDQYSDYDENGVLVDQRRDGDFAYTIPVIIGHFEQAFMQKMRTVIEYEMSSKNKTDADSQGLAKMCEALAVEEKERLMTEDLRIEEVHNSLCAGESYRCLIWGVNPDNPKTVRRIKYKTVEVEQKRRECQACQQDVPAGVEACECGATFIKEISLGTIPTQVEDGTVEIPLSENILHIPHMMSVQRSLTAQRFRHSTFIIERDYLPRHVAQWQYQTHIIEGNAGLSEENRMRREQERSSMQTDAIVGSAREQTSYTANDVVEREHIYMDVSEYGWFYVSKKATLPDGKEIEEGKLLGEVFPDGLYMLVIGNTIIKVKGMNKNRRWSAVFYGKRPGTSKGAGLQALIPLQDVVNDSFNLDYSIGMKQGHPLTVIARQFIRELPEAGNILFADKLPSSGIDGVVKQFPGQAASGVIAATADRVESVMQYIAGTYSMQGNFGAADQKVMGTATGVASARENADGRMIGPNKFEIAADKELMLQILENIRDFSVDEQKRELEKRFGPDIAKKFFNCNFRQVLNISVSKNTDMPRSSALDSAKAMALAQLSAGLARVPWGAELLATVADTMGISVNIGQGRNDRREAEYRLNKLAAIEDYIRAKKEELLANDQQAAEFMYTKLETYCGLLGMDSAADEKEVAAFMFMQDHEAFKDVYKDWIFGEEAKTATNARKLCVAQMWLEHEKALKGSQIYEAQFMKELQDEIAPPPEEPSADEAMLAAAAAQEEQERMREQALEDEDLRHEREQEAKDADLEREKAKMTHKAQTQLIVKQAEAEAQQNGARQ